MECRSKGEKEELESFFGTRYSVLVDLPYYSSVRMAIIDPMHNLFLRTAKQMLKLWKEIGILDDDSFKKVETNLDGIEAPSDIGKLPIKLVSAFASFTAGELKKWTALFSIYALKGTMQEKHLECWRSFVLATKILCSKVLTDLILLSAWQINWLWNFVNSSKVFTGKSTLLQTCISMDIWLSIWLRTDLLVLAI